MRKPTVLTRCVANTYVGRSERIIEVSDRETGKGCLISIQRQPNGDLIIGAYSADNGVFLRQPSDNKLVQARK